MTRYVRIAAADNEKFAHLLGVFNEAGFTVERFAGGNEFYVPENLELADDLRVEVAKAVRPGTLPAQFAPADTGRSLAPSESNATAADVPAGEATAGRESSLPPLPPKAGAGSSRDAWAEAAEARKIKVTDDMSRDDIIHAIEKRGSG